MKTQPFLLVKNILSSFASSLVLTLVSFFSLPYIVRNLGAAEYGILSLGLAVAGYVGVMELGIGKAITKFIPELMATQQLQRLRKMISSGLTISLVMGFVVTIVIFLASPLLASRVFHLEGQLLTDAIQSFYFIAFAVGLSLPNLLFRGILNGLQELVLLNKINTFFGIAKAILTVGVILVSGGVVEVIGSLLILSFIETIIFFICCVKLFPPELHFGLRLNMEEARHLLGYGFSVSLAVTVGNIAIHLDKILLGLFLPISAVGYFAVAMDISGKFWVIPGNILGAVYPAYSELSAIKDHEKNNELFWKTTKVLSLLLLFPALFVVIFSAPILRFWVGPEFGDQVSIALALTTVGVIGSCYLMSLQTFAIANGHPKLSASSTVCFAIGHVILAILFIPSFGMNGLAFSWFIVHLLTVVGLLMTMLRRRILQWPRQGLTMMLRILGLLTIVSFALLNARPLIHELTSLVVLGLMGWMIFLLLCYAYVLRGEEKRHLQSLLLNLWPKR